MKTNIENKVIEESIPFNTSHSNSMRCTLYSDLVNHQVLQGCILEDDELTQIACAVEDILQVYCFGKFQIKQSFLFQKKDGDMFYYIDGQQNKFSSRQKYARYLFTKSDCIMRIYQAVKHHESIRHVITCLFDVAWFHLYLYLEQLEIKYLPHE